MTNKVAIEPAFHFTSTNVQGGGSFRTYAFDLGLVYSPAGDRVGKGLYGRPFVGLGSATVGQTTSPC